MTAEQRRRPFNQNPGPNHPDNLRPGEGPRPPNQPGMLPARKQD